MISLSTTSKSRHLVLSGRSNLQCQTGFSVLSWTSVRPISSIVSKSLTMT